jgi:hypothetical protein
MYYGKSLDYKNFTLRARGELPSNAEGVLDKVYEKISASELYKPEKKFDIYLPGSRNEFVFFTLLQNGDYSRVNPYNGAIFIASADFGADRARPAPGAAAYRTLSDELTAAAAIELVRSAVEPLKYIFMKEWKARGYAERLAGGTGAFTPADICSGKEDDRALLDYKYGLTVEFAMKEEGISFPELLNKEYSYEKAAAGVKKTYCGG